MFRSGLKYSVRDTVKMLIRYSISVVVNRRRYQELTSRLSLGARSYRYYVLQTTRLQFCFRDRPSTSADSRTKWSGLGGAGRPARSSLNRWEVVVQLAQTRSGASGRYWPASAAAATTAGVRTPGQRHISNRWRKQMMSTARSDT